MRTLFHATSFEQGVFRKVLAEGLKPYWGWKMMDGRSTWFHHPIHLASHPLLALKLAPGEDNLGVLAVDLPDPLVQRLKVGWDGEGSYVLYEWVPPSCLRPLNHGEGDPKRAPHLDL